MGEKKGFFSRLVSGLTKTRKNIASGLDSIFHGFSKIDDDFYEELEEILIMSDIGVNTTEEILDKEIEDLIAERQEARKAKNFARADEIRDELLAKGIILKDTREGVKWKRA